MPGHDHEQAATAAEPAPRVAAAMPAAGLAAAVRSLQRRAGNAATLRWLGRQQLGEDTMAWQGIDPTALAALDAARKSKLESKYSVTVDGSWSAEDFADLENGLGMLKSSESARLNGFTMRRVSTIAGGSTSGLTTYDPGKGVKLVEYADTAFDHGGSSNGVKRSPLTVNGVPQGQHVVLHEVGHVVLYTNSNDTAEKAWAPVAKTITKDISTQPNGKATAPVEELYCESFACFHTGPDQLKSDAPSAHAYFAGGKYLS